MEVKQAEQLLKAPFAYEDVEFRIARVFKGNTRAAVLAYITSRAVMERLDEVLGLDGWYDTYNVLNNGVVCTLSLKLAGNWVTKQDSAPFTNIEALKGGFSDALKRAAVKFGIGRYLYKLPDYSVELTRARPQGGNLATVHSIFVQDQVHYWVQPSLPSWAVKGATPKAKTTNHTTTPPSNEPVNKPDKGHNQNPGKRPGPPTNQEQLKPVLLEFAESLLRQNALTPQAHTEYVNKINQASSKVGLLKFFHRQFMLIDQLYTLSRKGAVPATQKSSLYKDILNANSNRLMEIEQTLNQLAA